MRISRRGRRVVLIVVGFMLAYAIAAGLLAYIKLAAPRSYEFISSDALTQEIFKSLLAIVGGMISAVLGDSPNRRDEERRVYKHDHEQKMTRSVDRLARLSPQDSDATHATQDELSRAIEARGDVGRALLAWTYSAFVTLAFAVSHLAVSGAYSFICRLFNQPVLQFSPSVLLSGIAVVLPPLFYLHFFRSTDAAQLRYSALIGFWGVFNAGAIGVLQASPEILAAPDLWGPIPGTSYPFVLYLLFQRIIWFPALALIACTACWAVLTGKFGQLRPSPATAAQPGRPL